jgi:hypothetical protein
MYNAYYLEKMHECQHPLLVAEARRDGLALSCRPAAWSWLRTLAWTTGQALVAMGRRLQQQAVHAS